MEYICFDDCGATDISAIAACSSLNYLQLCGCPNVTDESFANGSAGCVSLLNCNVYYCPKLRETAVSALLHCCAKLKTVRLCGDFDLLKVFAIFQSVSKLRKFTCSDPSGKWCLAGTTVRAMATAFPCLELLDLNFQQSTVADADIEALVRGCKLLTSFYLWKWPLVTDIGVLALAKALTRIHSLDLHNLNITNAAVRAVGTHCKTLSYLSVNYCHLLTDAAFTTLDMICLYSLSISGTSVTGTFATHVLTPESNLGSFYCVEADQLNVNFVHSVSLPNKLRTLCLGRNLLTVEDWLELTTKFPNVRDLFVRNSQTVNDDIAISFHDHCPKLCVVTFTECSVTQVVIEQLQKRRKGKAKLLRET